MNNLAPITVMLFCALVAATPFASAQGASEPRGFIVVNGSYQVQSHDFERTASLRANAEDASFRTEYEVKGGPAFDAAGGVRVSRRLAIGAGVSRFSRSTAATLNGSVPHPFFFNRPRPVAGDVAALDRADLAVHVQARAIAPLGPRMQLAVFGGPSFFHVTQDIVSTFTWADSYPFDTATFASATTVNATGSKVGFNAGAEVAYFFSRRMGVGGTVQFSGATVELDAPRGAQDVKAGGTNVGGGLHLRF